MRLVGFRKIVRPASPSTKGGQGRQRRTVELGFEKLTEYVKRMGDALVPDAYSESGFKLGQWVNVQRNAYRDGRLEFGPHRSS